MAAEDVGTSPQEARWVPAVEINIDRFHQTWLTGLILCAEAAGPQPIADLVV